MSLLWILGMMVALVGYIWLLQVTFDTHMGLGMACLLIPLVSMFFPFAGLAILAGVAFYNFHDTIRPIVAVVVGRFIMSICAQPGGG